MNFVLRAMRSLEGSVAGADGRPVTVTVLELGRLVNTDPKGHFIIRGMPAGQFTLVAGDAPPASGTKVTMPEAAGAVRNVTLRMN
jgi:hypothetical protein